MDFVSVPRFVSQAADSFVARHHRITMWSSFNVFLHFTRFRKSRVGHTSVSIFNLKSYDPHMSRRSAPSYKCLITRGQLMRTLWLIVAPKLASLFVFTSFSGWPEGLDFTGTTYHCDLHIQEELQDKAFLPVHVFPQRDPNPLLFSPSLTSTNPKSKPITASALAFDII